MLIYAAGYPIIMKLIGPECLIVFRLRERTYSLWGYMQKYTNDYLNPFYKKEHNLTNPCTIPTNNPQALV